MIGAEALAVELKFMLFILTSLIGIFLIVIYKIINDSKLSFKQKWIFSLLTPVSIVIGLIISNLTENGGSIGLIMIFLILMNLSYLSKPITCYFSELIYDGNNGSINKSIFWLLSLVIPLAEIGGIFGIFILIMKK